MGEENKAYYQSPMFGRIVNYLQQNPKRVHIRDRGGRRSFLIDRVPTVAEAIAVLSSILDLEAL